MTKDTKLLTCDTKDPIRELERIIGLTSYIDRDLELKNWLDAHISDIEISQSVFNKSQMFSHEIDNVWYGMGYRVGEHVIDNNLCCTESDNKEFKLKVKVLK